MRRHSVLEENIAPVVAGLGYTFVGLQYFPQGRHTLVRLYVDKPGGVTIDDCERVSRQVDAIMGVKVLLQGEYTLEVSSPGIDRLLFTPEQFEEQLGKQVSVKTVAMIEGRRNFKGTLDSVSKDSISIQVEGKNIELAFADIDEARLVPKWP